YAELIERKHQELQENSAALELALERSLRTTAQLQQEIAERKRAELVRDRLAGQLGAQPDFVEAMAEGAVTLAMDQTVLYCNHRFAELLGVAAERIVGAPVVSFIDPASQEAFRALFEQARRGSTKAELNLRHAAGEALPVQMALNRFHGPELQAVAMVVTDLRDYRRNQEVLAQGRLAQLILEYSMTGIAVCDPEGRITLASCGLRELCGRSPLLMPFDEVFTLSAGDTPFSIAEVLRGRTHFSREVILQRADGRRFTLLLSAGPIADAAGNCAGCVVVLVDVSEWKQVEETLRRSEKLAAAGRIASTLAHEVNNPLTSVTNLLFLLEGNESLDADARRYLAQATVELARVSHIVRSTLAFYRESTTPVRLNLPQILDNVVELFHTNIRAKGLSIEKRYHCPEPGFGFPGETRQVVSNLVANAIDAAPERGRVLLRVYSARHHRTGAPGVRIVVADTGSGISADHLPRLFEPFFTTKGEKGTGLGLWVTQGIVQKHGGSIRVRSRKANPFVPHAHGTVFSVFFPVRTSATGVDAAAHAAGAAEIGKAA
ncbi:MAG: ATP-binding protein, partial [Sideroxydans sp.]